MADVHPAAEVFGSAADRYERGRPDYPQAAVDALVEGLDLGVTSTVVEVGAGTGKFSRPLARRVGSVIAVEPSAGMRAHLRVGGVNVVGGVAEQLPVSDASVDAVVAAQAWHWVDPVRAVPEARRVLRGGGIGLVWNVRDDTDEVNARVTALVAPYLLGAPTHRWSAWRSPFDGSALFEDFVVERFEHAQILDRAGLVDRALSWSYVASQPAATRADIAVQVEQIFADASGPASTVAIPYVTEVHVARIR